MFLVLVGAVMGAGIGMGASALLFAHGERERSGETLAFEDVCDAARRAKESRRSESSEERLEREYVDGVDGVMAELMNDGYCESPEAMQAAYLAGGDPEEDRAIDAAVESTLTEDDHS